jgi:hypothetical protein
MNERRRLSTGAMFEGYVMGCMMMRWMMGNAQYTHHQRKKDLSEE